MQYLQNHFHRYKKDGFGITKKGIDYFSPLIQGEGLVD